jgi:hypothetical protein
LNTTAAVGDIRIESKLLDASFTHERLFTLAGLTGAIVAPANATNDAFADTGSRCATPYAHIFVLR